MSCQTTIELKGDHGNKEKAYPTQFNSLLPAYVGRNFAPKLPSNELPEARVVLVYGVPEALYLSQVRVIRCKNRRILTR